MKYEIDSWLEMHNYKNIYMFIVDNVHMDLNKKISKKDLENFEEEFKNTPKLRSVSRDKNGNSEYSYEVQNDLLKKLSKDLSNFIKNEKMPIYNFMITNTLSIYTKQELSKDNILKIEKRFNVKFKKFTMNCSNDYEYYFR